MASDDDTRAIAAAEEMLRRLDAAESIAATRELRRSLGQSRLRKLRK
jgi:hypothetical protein